MTLKEVYGKGKAALTGGGIENAAFEAMCLLEKHFNADRTQLVVNASSEADPAAAESFFADIQKRISGIPLQYILGQWDFSGNTFFVGEGVLIPRPETELLVQEAVDHLSSHKAMVGMDLCSGSGCIGISLAKRFPDIKWYCLELSDDALVYLNKNIEYHEINNAIPVKCDILQGKPENLPRPDLIVCNPPYIPASDIQTLQKEVRREPEMALDGGGDGLVFYRALAEKWFPQLNKGGFLAVEFGISQGGRITEIFKKAGLTKISLKKDYNGIERLLTGQS